MDLSVVIPVFNESVNIEPLHQRLSNVMRGMGLESFELIFVNDGSTDGTDEKLLGLRHVDPRVKFIDLSRNFGHQIAVTAGLDHATGQVVVIMDADLQDPPEVIPELLSKYREGHDVVYAVRASRQGENLFKKLTAKIFYRLMRRLTDFPIPVDAGDFRLLSRRVVRHLCGMREQHRFLRGMVSWVGFRQAAVPYERAPRLGGETKYPLGKMLRLSFDAITAFSDIPLRLSTWFGFFTAFLSFLTGAYIIFLKLFTDKTVQGWASTLLAFFFLGGVQLICLGMIGEYIGRINDQIKQRPLYVVAEKHGLDTTNDTAGDPSLIN